MYLGRQYRLHGGAHPPPPLMSQDDDPATTDPGPTDDDPGPPAPAPDPSPSPSGTTEGQHRFAGWAHPPPVRVGWIADATQEILGATGRVHVFGADGLRRVGARKAGESLMEVADWIAARCIAMVFVADGDGTEGSRVFDLVRPVNPLRLSHDAGEDEGEDMAHRALDEGRAVVANGPRGGDFARSPACKSFLAAIEEKYRRPVEVLVVGFAKEGSLAPSVDPLLARGHRVTVVRDATSFPARNPLRRPPSGWAGDGVVRSVADLRASWGRYCQGTFADQEIEEAHERMESLARRAPRFSSLHILDEAVPWELYRARLEGPRTFPNNLALADEALTDDALVTWKCILLGAIYEVSDDDLEFLVLDRLSFRRFAGLALTERPPRARALKANRKHWIRAGVMAELVADVDRRWRKEGYGLPGLERLMGTSQADSGDPEDGGLDKAGLRPGPQAVSAVSRGSRRRSRRKRKKKRRRRHR